MQNSDKTITYVTRLYAEHWGYIFCISNQNDKKPVFNFRDTPPAGSLLMIFFSSLSYFPFPPWHTHGWPAISSFSRIRKSLGRKSPGSLPLPLIPHWRQLQRSGMDGQTSPPSRHSNTATFPLHPRVFSPTNAISARSLE